MEKKKKDRTTTTTGEVDLQPAPFTQDGHCGMRTHRQRALHTVLSLLPTGAHLEIFTREDKVKLFLGSSGVWI